MIFYSFKINNCKSRKESIQLRFIVDVFSKKKRYIRRYHPNKLKKGNSHFFRIYFEDEKSARYLIRKLERKNIRYKSYHEEYARNTNYRNMFFRQTQGPYRCRYCNRRLSDDEVIVDHIIPVKQAINNKKAQRMLRKHGIENVNEITNLVASCSDCNELKGTQLGEWTKKGFLGFWKYHIYRILSSILRFLILSGIIYYIIIIFQ